MSAEELAVRLDKWLWAARFYKTRTLASEAIQGGHVRINGQRAKPAHHVQPGEEIALTRGAVEITLIVEQLSRQRGPAPVAQTLYRETEESLARREALRAERTATGEHFAPQRKPDKKDRRTLQRFLRGQ